LENITEKLGKANRDSAKNQVSQICSEMRSVRVVTFRAASDFSGALGLRESDVRFGRVWRRVIKLERAFS